MKSNQLNFAREKKSKALINTDETSLIGYRQTRANFKRVDELKGEVNSLKSDIQDIKQMLKSILNGSSNG